jgi:serine/threonine protein kinase
MDVKVGDFGLAVKMSNLLGKRRSICGTPNYIAPEILEEKPYSYEVDIWSAGIIMFALLFGRPPFESETVK